MTNIIFNKELWVCRQYYCEALSHCHSPSEALSCQHRFAEASTAEYLEEANKLTVLMTKIANDGFAFLQYPAAEKVGAT